MAPTPPATSNTRSNFSASLGNLREVPYGPSILSGGRALLRCESEERADVVGPLWVRRVSVTCGDGVAETEATLNGLYNNSWR